MEALQSNFAVYGLPTRLVSDNGSPFQSKEFAQFCKINGIEHITSPPYHPMSNGAAERAVQTVKKALKKYMMDEAKKRLSLASKIAFFLFRFNNMPSTVTGVEPNALVLGYRAKTLISMLNKKEGGVGRKRKKGVVKKEGVGRSKKQEEKTAKKTELEEGQEVLYFNAIGKSWQKGLVSKRLSKSVYIVKFGEVNRKCHRDQLRPYLRHPTSMATPEAVSERTAPISPTPENEVWVTPPERRESENQPRRRRRRAPSTHTPTVRRSERILAKKLLF